jgi:hypothetical protein
MLGFRRLLDEAKLRAAQDVSGGTLAAVFDC